MNTEADTGRLLGTSVPVGLMTHLVRGWCLHDLGRPEEAADLLATAMPAISALSRRSRARFAVRQALALADAGDTRRAGAVATEALEDIRLVDSATVRADLRAFAAVIRRHPPSSGRLGRGGTLVGTAPPAGARVIPATRNIIFISFRTGDGDVLADHLDTVLRKEFGDDYVFRSGRSIPPGTPFDDVIHDALDRTCVLLVIIGPRWAGGTAPGRRIDDPGDWVRTEVARSLAAGIRVIPVLLNGTPLPLADELPDELKDLSKRQAVPYRTKFGPHDSAYLIARLREIHEIGRLPPYRGPVHLPPRTSRRLDLQPLDDLLTARRWEEADRESARMLWAAAGGDPNTSRAHLIRVEEIDDIAREDLDAIDRLWRHHSDGRFGFTPQLDALRRNRRDLLSFGRAVGWWTDRWIFYSEARFSLSAPRGHLPILGPVGGVHAPWRLRQFRHSYGTLARIPVELTRYLNDPETARREHAQTVDDSFGWREYMRLHTIATFDLVAAALKGRGRPLRRTLMEAPARRMVSNYTQLISVVWAINQVRLLDRLD
ncbi:GUN4 domain-containing protein [Thermopolyspora sp. NPDC052614]|uniref:GUN4 domain-containing protein n=1 Tax=Thermopolyspora sp. NPDC052614 TaxID=3155682 RepID=UPI003416A69E